MMERHFQQRETSSGNSNVQKFLTEVMRRLRKSGTPSQTPRDTRRADLYFEEVRLHHPKDAVHGPYLMPLVTLRTSSCGWSATSGCTMCGYHLGSTGRHPTSTEDLLEQTRWAIRRVDPGLYHTLVFTSNGSFLDPDEVPDVLRPTLLRMLYDAGFRFVVVETRPRFVTNERLDNINDCVASDGM